MFRTIGVALALAALSGCASTVMKNYLGRPLQSVMIDYGPPANAFDMPDGTRAFQWVTDSSFTMPVQSFTSGSVTGFGNSAFYNSNTTITGGVPITSRCAYTMFARWDDGTQTWTMTGFQKPKAACE